MKYERSYAAVMPRDFPDNRLAKVLNTIYCPFCGSQFEPTRYEACEETRKKDCWERNDAVCSTLESYTPIVIRCKECGIEIHNLSLYGYYYGEKVKEKV